MQQAFDCDMVLAHDDDLGNIDGLGLDSVSGFLNNGYIFLFMSAVTGNSRTRRDDGSPAEVQRGDT